MAPPTETSPLLSATQDTIGPQAADGPSGSGLASGVQPKTNGTFPTPPDSEDGDLERRVSEDERRLKQYEGNKEIASRMKYILPAIGIGIWLSAADQTLVVSSYGRIGSDLKELNKTNWIATAYFLTLTSFQPLYGKLADIFGRKPMLLVAYTLFGLGCLWCGMARSMNELIVARAFAGIGGGGMTTVTSILMSDIVPLKDRGMWQGIVNIIYAAGSSIGAPLGGILADTIGWRWAFIGQGPICLIAFIACYFVLQLPASEKTHWSVKLKRIDFLGAFTLVSAIALLLVGLDRGSNITWDNKVTIITLALSAPMFLLFVFVEARVASEPFAPGRVIFTRSMLAGYLCNFFSFGGWFGVLFYSPLYFQGVDNLSASGAGLRLIPGIICGVTGSVAAGLIMRSTGKYYYLNMGAYLLLTIASIPLVLFTGGISNSTAGIIVALCLGGLGNGTGVTSSLIVLISNADPTDQAIATACSYLFRSLGSVLGLSVVSSFLQQQLKTKLTERMSAPDDKIDEIVKQVRESLEYITQLPADEAAIVRSTYGESLRYCFILIGGIVACSFISSCKCSPHQLLKL